MSILERESRGLPETRTAWCSLWRLTVDPLEKSCYRWRNTELNPKRRDALLRLAHGGVNNERIGLLF